MAAQRAAISAVVTTVVAVMPVFLVGGLAVRMSQDLHMTTAQLGAVVSVYFGVTAAGSMPVGRLVERWGAALTARIGILLAAASMVAVAAWATSFAMLLGILAAAALANALGQLAANALLGRRVRTGRQGIAFGAKQAAIPLATLLAGASVPVAALTVGWRWVYVAGAVSCLPALALVPNDDTRGAGRASRPRGPRGSGLAALGLGAGLGACAATSMSTFLVASAVASGRQESTAGLMLTLGAATCVVTRILLGSLADRWRRGHLALVAGLLATGALGLTVLGQDLPTGAVVAGVAIGYGLGWSFPGLLTYAVVRLHPGTPAAATSVVQTGVYAGNCVGPLTFGLLASQFGFTLAWSTAGTAMALSAYLVLLGARQAHRAPIRARQTPDVEGNEYERIDSGRRVVTMPGLKTPRRAGQLGLAQIVAVEVVVLLAGMTAYAFPSIPVAATGFAAMLLLLPAVGRYRARWCYEAAQAWLVLRARKAAGARAAVLARPAGRNWPELAALSPRLVLRSASHRGRSLGVAEDDRGWFAAIAITAPDGLSRGNGGLLRLEWLTRLAEPFTAVQVVVRHTPFTGLGQPPSPSTESYRALHQALGVAFQRDVWIAVRIGQPDAATVAGDRGLDGVHAFLASAVVRISDALTSRDIEHRVLDCAALREALVGAYCVEPPDPRVARVRRAPRESWGRFRAGRTVHVCFAVARWPAKAPADLLAQLAGTPGATAVCTAVVVRAIRRPEDDDGPLGARVLVRVVAPADRVAMCIKHLGTTARRLRLRLVRLDGEHAPAVYATMPTAMTDGWGHPWGQ